jgi:pantothenate kinase
VAAVTPAPAVEELVREVHALLHDGPRVVVGLAGAPGAGKSTVAAALVARLRAGGTRTALVPMDGFHLDQVELERLGLAERKGAPDTFDVVGYVALLHRLRERREPVTYAPRFDRHLEQSIGSAVAVDAATQVVVTEGNYLLLDPADLPGRPGPDEPMGAWSQVRALLDRCWFVDTDDTLRVDRLVARHVEHGRSPAAAREWVQRNDEANAALVARTRARADRVVRWG